MRGLPQANGHGLEGAKAWLTSTKKRKGAGARSGPTAVPSQEQIKAAQMMAVKDLRGTTEIQLSNRWRELAVDTGGTGTKHAGLGTESKADPLPQAESSRKVQQLLQSWPGPILPPLQDVQACPGRIVTITEAERPDSAKKQQLVSTALLA
ncbi:hypothetical protein NDU88_004325 [Pleurodeles waltl]|uniref:Uncharacterized protein n=1 Tax=Pleurodeles waltl TaxID=8319 RepID=A0AAV7V2Q5_PLEWA|nr:hypothetical protein NDU88_004325 [Pleurodeles waltl]